MKSQIRKVKCLWLFQFLTTMVKFLVILFIINNISRYRYNAKYLQLDWLKQHAYFLIFLITTVQISMECETQKS